MGWIEYLTSLLAGLLYCPRDDNTCTRERLLIGCWIYLVIVFLQSILFAAPYGKFLNQAQNANSVPDTFLSWRMPAQLGWMLQEIPAALMGLLGMYEAYTNQNFTSLSVLVPFTLHYLNRSVIFPLRIKTGKPVPVFTVLMAFQFCFCNGLLQNLYLTEKGYFLAIQSQLIEYLGLGLFVTGMYVNLQADSILTNLRKPGEKGYKIPFGGMFAYLSAPNYAGEILEWWGWFLFNPTPGSFWFACFTNIFLGTRALKTHQFYTTKFDNYPRERKALIPFLL
jgi:3-oxo-5-alpha-steroid 4-dehydrogenase 1